MIKNIYSVYDNKARIYSTPFYSLRDEVALRDFQRAINDPNNELFQYPGDFDLAKLGTFDDTSGIIFAENPQIIQNGQFLRKFDAE